MPCLPFIPTLFLIPDIYGHIHNHIPVLPIGFACSYAIRSVGTLGITCLYALWSLSLGFAYPCNNMSLRSVVFEEGDVERLSLHPRTQAINILQRSC